MRDTICRWDELGRETGYTSSRQVRTCIPFALGWRGGGGMDGWMVGVSKSARRRGAKGTRKNNIRMSK